MNGNAYILLADVKPHLALKGVTKWSLLGVPNMGDGTTFCINMILLYN